MARSIRLRSLRSLTCARSARANRMMSRNSRMRTAFQSWVNGFGVRRLELALRRRGIGVTAKGIYDWRAGRRDPPGRTALAIIEISGGQISFRDLYPEFQSSGALGAMLQTKIN